MSDLLANLNDKQLEAVTFGDGPLLLLAGAGSGKTRVLTHRIAYLIAERGINPYQILALTFTNKAAGEMRERVDNLVESGAESIWVSTFHSTCARILRRYIDRLGYDRSFTIYDADDQKALMKDIIRSRDLDPKKYKERSFLNAISHAKDELISSDEFEAAYGHDYNHKLQAEMYAEYQKRLKSNNAVDFDDLIYLTVSLFTENDDVLDYYQERFRYILVDEYQDTNTAQFRLLALLASRYKNLCVVGDDDQSIYKFRGANIYNILNYEKVFPDAKVIRLEQNYRSTKNILAAASNVIKNNTERKDKTLWTTAPDGELIIQAGFNTDYEEAAGVAGDIRKRMREEGADYSDFAILYRTNAQSRIFEEKLVYEGIPYRIIGAINFYARKEIKDLLCYLKTVNNADDDIAVKRIINIPKRGIGQTSINRLQDYADENGISFYDALVRAEYIPGLGRSQSGITSFVNMIEDYRQRIRAAENPDNDKSFSLEELIKTIIDETDYVRDLEAEETPEAEGRIENIQSLVSKVAQYEEDTEDPTLAGLLEEIALVADIDTVDMEENRVLLMTLHGAKGLEFPYVYMVGMEEGLFPGGMAAFGDDEEELEEERRLCYVGITRAKKLLTLTNAKQRMRNGNTEFNRPSRFINEIPRHLIRQVGSAPRQPARSIGSEADLFFGSSSGTSFGSSSGKMRENTGYSSSAARRSTPGNKSNFFTGNPYISKGLSAKSPSSSIDYGVGDTVKHAKFGIGTITDMVKKDSDYEVTIDFEGFGNRKLRSSFAKLEKI
ncbi:MAG: UvrD-helicase domain-containing protein [Eubacterium sp.]|nr:UvrD-helicase domain-containing protein [Eubacterium sp.]